MTVASCDDAWAGAFDEAVDPAGRGDGAAVWSALDRCHSTSATAAATTTSRVSAATGIQPPPRGGPTGTAGPSVAGGAPASPGHGCAGGG